jgi:DNA-binding GntR family transcriptional regulator
MSAARTVTGPKTAPPRAPESAQDLAHRWLKRHIATLPQHAGTFLTESEVAEATGTSRTPVREALLRLETEGLLQIVPKKGAFVPPITDAEVHAVMAARGLIEDWCVRRAMMLCQTLSATLDRLLCLQEDLSYSAAEFIECVRIFHRSIVRAAGNPVLGDFYESLRDRQVRMGLRALAGSPQRTAVVLAEHAEIAKGVRAGDTERAAAAMASHLAGTLAALHTAGAGERLPPPPANPGSADTGASQGHPAR